jgi:glutamyl-tRNA reductase
VEVSLPAIPVWHVGPTASALSPGSAARDHPGVVPLSLFGLEFSLETASLDALEAVTRAVTPALVSDWFSRFSGTEEVALLSTCHRVELTLLVRFPEERDKWQDVLPGKRSSWTAREGREAVHHLFRVAAGRESLAVGEAEVRDQVRTAAGSVLSRYPRRFLRDLFVRAAEAAGERVPSVPAPTSIASIAARRLLELVGRPCPRVLVIGSGTVGRQVTEHLAFGARVTLVYHQRPPADEFLAATGARAVPLPRLREELTTTDAIVTAAKFGSHGLRAPDLPRDQRLVLVDLGVPRNIDPSVRELPNARLVDLEELHAFRGRSTGPDDQDRRVEELADRCSDTLEASLLEPWIGAFRRAAEDLRRSEIANARPFLGTLDPSQELAIERLTRRLVGRLLQSPTERIRSLPPGPEGDRMRRFATELLDPDSAGP